MWELLHAQPDSHEVSGVFDTLFCISLLTVAYLSYFNLSSLELGGEAGDLDSCKRGTVFLQVVVAGVL